MLFLGLGTGPGSAVVAEHVIMPLELGSLSGKGNRTLAGQLVGKGSRNLDCQHGWMRFKEWC